MDYSQFWRMSEVEVKDYLKNLATLLPDIQGADAQAEAVCTSIHAAMSHHRHLREWWLALPKEGDIGASLNVTLLVALMEETGLTLEGGEYGIVAAKLADWGTPIPPGPNPDWNGVPRMAPEKEGNI